MYILIEAFSAAILLLPFFLLLWKRKWCAFPTAVLYYVFAVYLSAVYFLTGLPTVQFAVWDVNLNLVPFAGMAADLKNAILNVLLFIPCGFLLPLLWKKFRSISYTLGFGLAMTLSIELLQLFTFRATDINDILTNFLGTFLGTCVFHALGKRITMPGSPERQPRDAAVIILITAAVMFFAQPFLVTLIYSVL